MRIDDSSHFSYVAGSLSKQAQPVPQKNSNTSGVSSAQSSLSQSAAETQSSGAGTTPRSERIEQLKQMMAQGQPINVSKLADSMMKSGLFVDENA